VIQHAGDRGLAGGRERQPFWGEMHTHSAVSDGNGSMEDCFAIARSHLDFWALADHAYGECVFSPDYRRDRPDHLILNEEWARLQELCRTYEAPGEFVPFLAYEWTNFGFGHHNVYYLDYDQPIRMPATLPALYESLRTVDAMVIPHHTGYPVGLCGKDWDHHDETLTPFVELYSLHGSSEEPGGIRPLLTTGSWMGPGASGGSVQEGLARGYKLGIIASSDAHGEHPGAYDLGLVAAYAEELTRYSLWDAFKAKRVYGVTGDRIALDVAINGHPMGSTLQVTDRRVIDIGVVAWDKVERLDIVKNNALLHSVVEPAGTTAPDRRLRFRFMVEWGWNRKAPDDWEGHLELRDGRILQAIPCYRGRVASRVGRGITHQTDRACSWTSHTEQHQHGTPLRRSADALWFDVECDWDAPLHLWLSSGGRRQELRLLPADILARSVLLHLEPVPYTTDGAHWRKMETLAKMKVHQGWPIEQLALSLHYEDDTRGRTNNRTDFYYVRVIQRNGQRAWSSPIWVET
jgi:hypothetical protein